MAELIDNLCFRGIDSRLKGYNGSVTHPVANLERTFCINCGNPKGWVTTESASYIRANSIIVICDECEQKLGKPNLVEANIQEHG